MPKLVIHHNDGHVDDILSSLLLWLSPRVDLQAVTITAGDCYPEQSLQALLKMATFLDLEGAEVAMNDDPVPNPFPENWRRESFIMNELSLFSENSLKIPYQPGRPRRSEALIVDCLSHSKTPMTIVATGPLTLLAKVFQERPELKEKVDEFVIMGGAFQVPGNVGEPGVDGSAEWNMFADPHAAKNILECDIPIKLIPLDVTNQLPVTRSFLARLEAQSEQSRASLLALRLWSLVKGFEYYFWDTLTAAEVINPELFAFKEQRIDISVQGKSQGKTSVVLFGGRKVKVATRVEREAFEELILETFRAR